MKDLRENCLSTIQNSLINIGYSSDDIQNISNVIVCVLSNYEITERITEVQCISNETEHVLKMYAGSILTEGKSPKTVKSYIGILQRFHRDIGNKSLLEVSTYDIRLWLAMQQQKNVSKRSCENYRSYLAAFYTWCFIEGVMDYNPSAKIKPIKYTEKVRLPFSSVELDALRHNCQNLRERAELELLLSSGIRVSEASQMNISDIDFNTNTVVVKEAKGGKQRVTYINDVCKKHLLDYLNSRTDNDESLFYTKFHTRVTKSVIESDLKRIGKQAGVSNVHPHRCRRTFATNMSKNGVNVRTIQVLMGHSQLNTTMEYISLNDGVIQNEYKRCS